MILLTGLGTGALTILVVLTVVLTLVYVVSLMEHRRDMQRRLNEASPNSNRTKDGDLFGVLEDLRNVENRLLKIEKEVPNFSPTIKKSIKRIHETQKLVYDLAREFERYSLRSCTEEARKVTYRVAMEASETFNDIVDLLQETKLNKDADGALDLVEDLNLYVDSEVSSLFSKIDRINRDLKK